MRQEVGGTPTKEKQPYIYIYIYTRRNGGPTGLHYSKHIETYLGPASRNRLKHSWGEVTETYQHIVLGLRKHLVSFLIRLSAFWRAFSVPLSTIFIYIFASNFIDFGQAFWTFWGVLEGSWGGLGGPGPPIPNFLDF